MSSKPISFGFGKPKGQLNPAAPSTKTSISLSLPTKPPLHKSAPTHKTKASALHGDDDEDQDEAEPKHEELAGFSASGAILSKPIEQKKELVIENAGNQDWRRKAQQAQGRGTGKKLLPAEVQAQRRGETAVMVEKDEVSTASGLQFAQAGDEKIGDGDVGTAEAAGLKERPRTADEEALQALLGDDDKPRGTAIIEARVDVRDLAAPVDDFASLVATHPDSATLDDYVAMPVEEFGMAMLRGMGKKRRANGEVIQLESTEQKEVKKRKQEGFLGIGARPAKGMEGVELGAWGKSDMRKNHKGVGFFSPVMVRDRKTGETITEEEWERRKSGRKEGGKEDDWRERRDRNLERVAKDGKNVDGDYEPKRIESLRDSRRAADKESDHESSRSRRHRSRSRSRETRRRDDGDGYDSRSSGGRRDRDRDRDRDRNRNRDRDRRDRGYDRDERSHRDRR